jgi:hypothetical protein
MLNSEWLLKEAVEAHFKDCRNISRMKLKKTSTKKRKGTCKPNNEEPRSAPDM